MPKRISNMKLIKYHNPLSYPGLTSSTKAMWMGVTEHVTIKIKPMNKSHEFLWLFSG